MEWFAIAFVLMSILDAIAKSKKKKQKLAAMRAESGDEGDSETAGFVMPEPAAPSRSGDGSLTPAVVSREMPALPDPPVTDQRSATPTSQRSGMPAKAAPPARSERPAWADATDTVETVARLMGLDSVRDDAQSGAARTEPGARSTDEPESPQEPPPYRPPRSAVPMREPTGSIPVPATSAPRVATGPTGHGTVRVHGSRRDLPKDPSYVLDAHRHPVSDDVHAMLLAEGRAGLRRAVILKEVLGPPMGIRERRTV